MRLCCATSIYHKVASGKPGGFPGTWAPSLRIPRPHRGPRMIPFRKAWALIFSTTLASCSPSVGGSGTVFSDSAGVTLASAETPFWAPGAGWRLSEEPTLQIGVLEGPEEYQFSGLVGAVRLSDGRIVVADAGSLELRFFGADGRFLSRVGREGDGPGEFRHLGFLGVFQGDSLATFDLYLRRVQIFGPDGGLARSYSVESMAERVIPQKVIDIVDGSFMAIRFFDVDREISNGIARWPHEIVATMDLRTGQIDSISHVPGSETFFEASPNGDVVDSRYIFGNGNEFSAQAGRIAIIATDTFSVTVSGLDGSPALIIRREVLPEPATEEQFNRYVDGVLQLVFPGENDEAREDVERYRRSLLDQPKAPTLPILRSVQLDEEGNIWLEMYYHPGEDPPPYQVFKADGTWLGEVAMPPGLDRGFNTYWAPYFQIGSDFILGVWKDELDVQYVRLYELVKG